MNASDFARARREIDATDDELADDIGVSPEVIRAWSDGRAAVPRRYAKRIEWYVDAARRDAWLESSGLPACPQLDAHLAAILDDREQDSTTLEAFSRHGDSCAICTMRRRSVEDRFGPAPPYPTTGVLRLIDLIEQVPRWARPALMGGLLLGGVVGVRVIVLGPLIPSGPMTFREDLTAILAATAAGASSGLAYTLVRPTLRRLGRPGDYLTGVVLAFAYGGHRSGARRVRRIDRERPSTPCGVRGYGHVLRPDRRSQLVPGTCR